MPRIPSWLMVTVPVVLAVSGGTAASAQDKYALKSPSGIAFSDFRGYENWAVVSSAQTEEVLKVIVANPVMIDAYQAGVPGNGKPFPDGSKIVKLQWKPKKSNPPPGAAAKSVDMGDQGGMALGAWRSTRTRSTMPSWRCSA
jgi:hypothetical protein